MSNTNNQPVKMTVLCVDDEVNILKSLKRLLHKQDFQLLLAENGQQGLELMAKQRVDVVVSDMKMPQMSGAEFLQKAANDYPNTYRILLSGYADIDSTVEAVNRGKIQRYLQKPWDNNELLDTINEGIQQVKLKYENERLQQVVAKQNALLKELNQNLEQKVELRTKQLRSTLERLHVQDKATQKVLFNLVSINPRLDGGFARTVGFTAKLMATKLGKEKAFIEQVSLAGLLCEIGQSGMSAELIKTPFEELAFQQQEQYLDQVQTALLLLAPAHHMNDVSVMICYQFEHVNGSGHPHKLAAEQIPEGAKLLAIARDYWRYRGGRIIDESLTDEQAKAEMKKYRGIRYDAEMLDVLLNDPTVVQRNHLSQAISANELKPGMQLKLSLFNASNILVLNEGHVFTQESIEKIQHYEESQEKPLAIVVC